MAPWATSHLAPSLLVHHRTNPWARLSKYQQNTAKVVEVLPRMKWLGTRRMPYPYKVRISGIKPCIVLSPPHLLSLPPLLQCSPQQLPPHGLWPTPSRPGAPGRPGPRARRRGASGSGAAAGAAGVAGSGATSGWAAAGRWSTGCAATGACHGLPRGGAASTPCRKV